MGNAIGGILRCSVCGNMDGCFTNFSDAGRPRRNCLWTFATEPQDYHPGSDDRRWVLYELTNAAPLFPAGALGRRRHSAPAVDVPGPARLAHADGSASSGSTHDADFRQANLGNAADTENWLRLKRRVCSLFCLHNQPGDALDRTRRTSSLGMVRSLLRGVLFSRKFESSASVEG